MNEDTLVKVIAVSVAVFGPIAFSALVMQYYSHWQERKR
jgi:hypothetical protein